MLYSLNLSLAIASHIAENAAQNKRLYGQSRKPSHPTHLGGFPLEQLNDMHAHELWQAHPRVSQHCTANTVEINIVAHESPSWLLAKEDLNPSVLSQKRRWDQLILFHANHEKLCSFHSSKRGTNTPANACRAWSSSTCSNEASNASDEETHIFSQA